MMIFPDSAEILIEHINRADEITLTVRTTSLTAPCPSCGADSSRIQSRYTRQLRDLPASGRPVHLIVHARRFFCKKSTCAQKIFTERLPELCRPHARAHHPAARSPEPTRSGSGRAGGNPTRKCAGSAWQSGYDLTSRSPTSFARSPFSTQHWPG